MSGEAFVMHCGGGGDEMAGMVEMGGPVGWDMVLSTLWMIWVSIGGLREKAEWIW